MRDGGRVIVDGRHRPRRSRDQVGAVALPAAGLEYVATCAYVNAMKVGDLVAAEPVVLHRQAGHGPLAGQWQGAVGRVASLGVHRNAG